MASRPVTFSNAMLSLFQSAAEEIGRLGGHHAPSVAAAAAKAGMARLAGAKVPGTPPPDTLEGFEICAGLGLDYLEARLIGDAARAAQLSNDLTGASCDPGWLTTLEAYLAYFGPGGSRRQIPYIRPAQIGDRVITLPAGARIALISDWGTGSEAAEAILRQAAAHRPDLLVHLGDIYYSGTPGECDRKFHSVIERVLGPERARIPVFTLSGNHDMYSGGIGYYGLIDRLNGGAMRQGASFFCLRSADAAWQILAMDTGLHDHDPFGQIATPAETFLDAEEQAWHVARLREFPGRTILLSHHPLFSAFRQIAPRAPDGTLDPVNRALLGSLRRFQAAGQVTAWFWGHEHNLCIYQPYEGLARGRCVGNGAIPVFVADEPYRPLAGLTNPPALIPSTQLGDDGTIMAHGYTIVTLGPASARADYHETGRPTPLFTETIGDLRPAALG